MLGSPAMRAKLARQPLASCCFAFVLAECARRNRLLLTGYGRVLGLVHRYRFDGVGTTVLDSIGTAHGTVVGAALTGQGTLTLVGATGR